MQFSLNAIIVKFAAYFVKGNYYSKLVILQKIFSKRNSGKKNIYRDIFFGTPNKLTQSWNKNHIKRIHGPGGCWLT